LDGNDFSSGYFYAYNLGHQIPGYRPMWYISPYAISGHLGYYQGNRDYYQGNEQIWRIETIVNKDSQGQRGQVTYDPPGPKSKSTSFWLPGETVRDMTIVSTWKNSDGSIRHQETRNIRLEKTAECITQKPDKPPEPTMPSSGYNFEVHGYSQCYPANSVNGMYHRHGDQNPIIPYQGRAFVHLSNTIIAYGPSTSGPNQLSLIASNPQTEPVIVPTEAELKASLKAEVEKILANYEQTGKFLDPGYLSARSSHYQMYNYFQNPGITLYTLSLAYPHLPELQSRIQNFLHDYYSKYFAVGTWRDMICSIGWLDTNPRTATELPPDLVEAIKNQEPFNHNYGTDTLCEREYVGSNRISYPVFNFYAMYKYAETVPGVDANTVYDLAKAKLHLPIHGVAGDHDLLRKRPFHINDWLSGLDGFLRLQELAGMQDQDASLRQQVIAEKDRAVQLRYDLFTKDNPEWTEGVDYYRKLLDISRNFIYLTPDSANYLADTSPASGNIRNKIVQALEEYEYVSPYWFVNRYEATAVEAVVQHLYNSPAIFQAKAWILDQPREELYKYLDVPAFERGDLFYIQNLVAALEAPTSGPQPMEVYLPMILN
jgi:hypothetical protein